MGKKGNLGKVHLAVAGATTQQWPSAHQLCMMPDAAYTKVNPRHSRKQACAQLHGQPLALNSWSLFRKIQQRPILRANCRRLEAAVGTLQRRGKQIYVSYRH